MLFRLDYYGDEDIHDAGESGVAYNDLQFTERYWRDLARETRQLAECAPDAARKALMLEVASNYDKLADKAAIRDKT